MSNFCVIPGCQSHQYIKTVTLFSVNSTPALENWWRSTPWNKSIGLVDPKICVAHFREEQLDRRQRVPRLMPNVVPSLRLPKGPTSTGQQPLVMEAPAGEACNNPLLLVCRFCSKKQSVPIQNHLEDLVESEELLQLCLGRGRFLEGFPSGVCDYCLDMIKITTNFIKDCEKAQEKLQKMFFGTSQQMVDSFEEGEACEVEPDRDLGASFAVPETVISFDDSAEFGLKHETLDIGDGDPLDDFDDDDDEDDDDELEEGMEPGEVKYVGHQMSAAKQSYTGKPTSKKLTQAELDGEVHCTICGQKFNRKRGLKAHMESIHEKKTFTCKICGKTMGWRKTLQRHMKSHEEGYYKHKCDLCDKTFSRPSHLKLHMSKHTGEKVRCPLCGNGLRCNYKLGEHLTKVHKLDPATAKGYVQSAVKTIG